jgi:hypothetical protein
VSATGRRIPIINVTPDFLPHANVFVLPFQNNTVGQAAPASLPMRSTELLPRVVDASTSPMLSTPLINTMVSAPVPLGSQGKRTTDSDAFTRNTGFAIWTNGSFTFGQCSNAHVSLRRNCGKVGISKQECLPSSNLRSSNGIFFCVSLFCFFCGATFIADTIACACVLDARAVCKRK